MSCIVRVSHHLLLMCCIMLSILNLSHTFNSVIAQYGYCSTGSISNLYFSSSLMNAADAPTIAYTHRIQPLRYISSTARLLMSSTDVETFSTADIEEYAKLLGLRLQYLNAFIRPIGILHLGSSMKCWSIVHHVTDYIYHRVIFYVTGVLIALGWILCVCVCS